MKRFRKTLLIIGIVLLVTIVLLAAGGTWFVRRPWSEVSGEIAISGLSAPVEIIRDEWGVPHIYAENEHDLFFAQGYVHAQDRLWQMEFNRRTGDGTLSAALGEALVDTDRYLRVFGMRRAAEEDWAILDDGLRAILQAYADGINAYIETHQGRLPLEFTILGVDPAPWTPVDVLAWGKLMCLTLGGTYDLEILRARIIAQLGEEAVQQLMPPYPDDAPLIIPPEVQSYAWLRDARSDKPDPLAVIFGERGPTWGSNNWVVHGSRTATGMPLLANDTHLSLSLPSIWYENGLHGGRFDEVGFTFPGMPLVVIGHNARIAWGVTSLSPDVEDLYIERLNDPVEPTQYEFMGEWHDLQIVQETIEVKGQAPVTLDVLFTRHGPIINDIFGILEDAEPTAFKWTASEGSTLIKSIALLNLATNWDEFRQAISFWDTPGQNFVYADMDGNIGYQVSGKIPIRAPGHQGAVPVPGWSGEYEWQGFIPFEELPYVLNPATGFIATANNKVVGDDYPYLLAQDWSPGYRVRRITDLLATNEHVTLQDMQAIQAQIHSLPAETLRPYLLTVEPETELQARALDEVKNWNLDFETDQVGASVYQVWNLFMVTDVLSDDLGIDILRHYRRYAPIHTPALIGWMAEPDNAWFDDVSTPEVETRDEMVRRSLVEAVDWLSEHYGANPDDWQWGRLHTVTLVHSPLGQSPLKIIFNSKTIPARGDSFTVDAASFLFGSSFKMIHGVSQRFIVDLSDLDNSLMINSTGQSGQAFHPHRTDMVSMWQNLEYHPAFFERQVVEDNATTVLTLTPP